MLQINKLLSFLPYLENAMLQQSGSTDLGLEFLDFSSLYHGW